MTHDPNLISSRAVEPLLSHLLSQFDSGSVRLWVIDYDSIDKNSNFSLDWLSPLPRQSYENHFSFLDNYRISPTILIKIYKISGDAGTIMWYSSWCRVVPSRFSGGKKWMKFEIADVPSLTRPVRAPRLF